MDPLPAITETPISSPPLIPTQNDHKKLLIAVLSMLLIFLVTTVSILLIYIHQSNNKKQNQVTKTTKLTGDMYKDIKSTLIKEFK